MADYFDSLETRDPAARESELLARLPRQVGHAVSSAPGWARHLAGVDAGAVSSRKALAALPVLRKTDLKALQEVEPPLGGFAAGGPETWGRLFMSPGPIFEPMGLASDPWRAARALHAAGLRKGDIVHNCFAYHLTPGGFILDEGARAMGCAVIPAGIGNTELQLDTIEKLKPVAYTGTPDFLKILQDKAAETGRDTSSIKCALVSGGALFPSLREEYRSRGVRVQQCYATADVGVIAYESEALEGMIVNEDTIVEIVRPGTGEPVPDGEVGEVVVTNFHEAYPMIRLATGDLSAILPGQSPCGRTNVRIKGWMGRADQTTKIKGMFVHPSQAADVMKIHGELGRIRLVVGRTNEQDTLVVRAECANPQAEGLAEAVARTVQQVCKVRGTVELVAPGSLPNDGLVIADERPATS
ncbi:MAG: AMP-binding protein [Anderseniella sp.]|jgi:phenylacetate-CoA ligase|nr:AMP-binding protein [Anderseniella sp.]